MDTIKITNNDTLAHLNYTSFQTQHVQMVVWMLQHRLLIQLHTYVFLVPCKHSASALDRRRPNYNRNLSVEESASWRSRHRDASYSESGSGK